MIKPSEETAKDKSIISTQDESRTCLEDPTDRKLHAAQEILAEVFGISLIEAQEMIKQRSRERYLWPEGFSSDD